MWQSPGEWLKAPGDGRLEIARSPRQDSPPSHIGDLKYPLSMVAELSRGGCTESPDVRAEGASAQFPSRVRFLPFPGFLGRRCAGPSSLQSTARWLIINITGPASGSAWVHALQSSGFLGKKVSFCVLMLGMCMCLCACACVCVCMCVYMHVLPCPLESREHTSRPPV